MEDVFVIRYPTPPNLPPPLINDPLLPLISIVTPSFNQGQFIRETIDSVLTQDYPNIEYWVIDGTSTDDTLSILKHYEQDARFHWISEPDNGQGDAINKGLARCQGALFMWLNSDDVLLPNALRYIGEEWRDTHQPGILYGLGRHIDEQGKDMGYCPAQSPTMTLEKVLWVGKHTFIQPATFAPLAMIRNVGGIDPTLHYTLDLDLWIKLAEKLPIKFVAHDIALYRLHSTSKTVSAPAKFIEEARKVMNKAAQRGTLSLQKAHSRSDLFAMRTYLMPDSINMIAAMKSFRSAVVADRAVFLEALFILLKASIRLTIGDRLWAWARFLKARWG